MSVTLLNILNELILTAPFCTFTVNLAVKPLRNLILMTASPTLFPVILPLSVTETIFLLLLVQETTLSPAASPDTLTWND